MFISRMCVLQVVVGEKLVAGEELKKIKINRVISSSGMIVQLAVSPVTITSFSQKSRHDIDVCILILDNCRRAMNRDLSMMAIFLKKKKKEMKKISVFDIRTPTFGHRSRAMDLENVVPKDGPGRGLTLLRHVPKLNLHCSSNIYSAD